MGEKGFEPLEYLAEVFGLDAFERYCIEMLWKQSGQTSEELADKYGKIVDFEPYFWQDGTLMHYFLLWQDKQGEKRLRLDERIAVFLAGKLDGYVPYEFLWERMDPSAEEEHLTGEGPVPVMERFFKEADKEKPVWFHLYGSRGIGRKSRILEFCRRQERSLLIIDGRILEEENEELLGAALRECRIYGAWLLLRDLKASWFAPSLHREKLFEWIGKEAEVVFTIGEEPLLADGYKERFAWLELLLSMPTFSENRMLWQKELEKISSLELAVEEWADKFVFTPGQIKEAVAYARHYAGLSGQNRIGRADLQRGCYRLLRGGMGSRAVRIPVGYTWEELVLPPLQKQKLREACNQAFCRKAVYESWGFGKTITYGRGISVVLAGPPGTGKTMAAQVMANELCLDLYRIELPSVVSKYIGETEKNLAEIFEQAKKSQVILFFDEADVLFSKRTQVQDSHDKYSNMEAAFLLQKMEDYDGITILATNFLQNFDEAFKRRMKFIIDLPFPDEKQRFEIWQRVFPPQTPLLEEPDYEFLAAAFELSGSNIKNVALHAAFLAASQGTGVTMTHLIQGVQNEYAKSGKSLTKEQLGQYYMLL